MPSDLAGVEDVLRLTAAGFTAADVAVYSRYVDVMSASDSYAAFVASTPRAY